MALRPDRRGGGSVADTSIDQARRPGHWWRAWLPAIIITGLFVVLGVYYSITTPIWEAPDETGHFGNVYYIAKHKKLPGPGTFYTWHQSPLYHIIAAQVISGVDMPNLADWTRPNPNAAIRSSSDEPNVALHSVRELPPYQGVALGIHLARWVNVVFGAATAALTYGLARQLFPSHTWIAVGAAGLVAFNPQFIFMSAAVQNDVPLAMASALTLWPALNIVQGDYRRRQFFWLGAMVGLAIIFKQSGIVLIGLAGLVVMWAAWQSKSWRNLWVWGSWTALALALLAGPMYLRNTWLYGDPFAYRVYKSLHPPVEPLRLNEVTGDMYLAFFWRMHRSFWGYFGWTTVPLPHWIYQVLWLLYPMALLGLGLWIYRGRRTWAQPRGGLAAVALLLIGVILVWIFTIRYTLSFRAFGVQGRYLFQMISAQAILLSLGLFSLIPGRGRGVVMGIMVLTLLGLACWVPGGVIAPAYEYLGDSPQVLDTVQFRRGDVFGEAIKLVGYTSQVDQGSGQVQTTLYWRSIKSPPGDYTIFVHLLDRQGNRISQHDRRPMDGRFPTNLWRPGDLVHTDHLLQANDTCRDGSCYLAVGFYDWESGGRLPVTEGVAEDNAVHLSQLVP